MARTTQANKVLPPVRAPLRTDLRLQILEKILYGKVSPGSHINESRLAKELNVSRTPVREALFHLEREGLVYATRDRGFFVQPLNEREVRETYPIIGALEALALRLSGPRAMLAVPELYKLNKALKNSKSPRSALLIDTHFHECLISSCPNGKLKEIIGSLRLLVRRYEVLYMENLQLIEISVRQHQSIVESIRAGQTERAITAIEENWKFTMDVLLQRLGEPSDLPRSV